MFCPFSLLALSPPGTYQRRAAKSWRWMVSVGAYRLIAYGYEHAMLSKSGTGATAYHITGA
ncbi:hypothetical protein KCP78_16475 [Salmonella enterica subsp. enterica]|nr:hypothetical protein KCP78_16475 [Salmonella enterica subsp. enterica]